MTLFVRSTSLRCSAGKNPEQVEGTDSDAFLLETPADLLCPITHELFHEPVINAAGQVYERVAIERALAHRLVDPISNLSLDSAALTTVWPMKSKATAYRERALRGCVERLCRPACRSPIRYLRRAAELSAGLDAGADPSGAVLGLPGLTREVVDYLLTHPSSIYDFQALSRYGASLAAGGHRDLSAGVYTQLLHLGGNSQQQVEALRGLLHCWGSGSGAGAEGQEEEEDDERQQRLVEKLAGLSCGEGPDGCRPARFVGVLLEAGLPEELVLRFCEHILGGSGATHGKAAAAPAGCGGGGPLGRIISTSLERGSGCSAAGSFAGPSEGLESGQRSGIGVQGGHLDLLFVYTKLRCGQLEMALAQRQACAGGISGGSCSHSDRGPAGAADGPAPKGAEGHSEGGEGKGRRRHVGRAVCSAVFALSTFAGGRPLARLLQVASAVVLLNPPLRRGDG